MNNMFCKFIVLFLFWLMALCRSQALDQCFALYPNLAMKCAIPLERRTPANKEQCQQFCLVTAGCRSVQLDQYKQQCDLFAVPSPLDTYKQPPPPFALQDDYDRFTSGQIRRKQKRAAPSQLDSGNSLDEFCEPSMVPSIGVIFMSPIDACIQAFFPSTRATATAAAAKNIPQPPPKSLTQILPLFPGCGPGETDRFELVDGIELVTSSRMDMIQLKVESADVCLHHCKMNAFPDGNRFPMPCRSAQFNRIDSQCIISDQMIQPNGIAQFASNVNMIYFERICLKEQAWMRGCDDLINRQPRFILLGHATAVVDSPSTQHCLEQCLHSQAALGFRCSSALLFFEFPTQNCILNRHSRHSRPAHFIAEDRQKVDYFELPPCLRQPVQAWRRDESTWTEWSKCDSDGKERRSRCGQQPDQECTGQQSRNCLSGDKFKKDFPNLINEQLHSESGQRFVELDNHQPRFVGNFSGRTAKIQQASPSIRETNALDYDEELLFFGPPMKDTSAIKPEPVEITSPVIKVDQKATTGACDPNRRCCPLSTATGERDCRNGYRIQISGDQVRCQPADCQ